MIGEWVGWHTGYCQLRHPSVQVWQVVLEDGGWARAAAAAAARPAGRKPWAVLVTGVNGIRKTTSECPRGGGAPTPATLRQWSRFRCGRFQNF